MIKGLADRLFKWYCNPEYYPDIKGDLEELHNDLLTENKKFTSGDMPPMYCYSAGYR